MCSIRTQRCTSGPQFAAASAAKEAGGRGRCHKMLLLQPRRLPQQQQRKLGVQVRVTGCCCNNRALLQQRPHKTPRVGATACCSSNRVGCCSNNRTKCRGSGSQYPSIMLQQPRNWLLQHAAPERVEKMRATKSDARQSDPLPVFGTPVPGTRSVYKAIWNTGLYGKKALRGKLQLQYGHGLLNGTHQ